ncbi:MAG: DUF1016 family protein, partial [Alphaproteobacteria bacterium]|nr:DUF1016 family protein [Alphaproteobacteria bacterium]
SEIQQTIEQTEENLLASVNYEKVKMSWQIGQKIEKFLRDNLQPDEMSNYGKQLVTKLAQDTGIQERTLYQMQVFYQSYKSLPGPEAELKWSHYRSLISVKDEAKRQLLEGLVTKKDLSSQKLRREVVKTNKEAKQKPPVPTKLKCVRGQVGVYKIKDRERIDLGFNIFLKRKNNYKAGRVVTENLRACPKSDAKAKQLHTYLARLDRVVDGDTIHVTLDLGFGVEHREILRLSQINAEEATTKSGKKATKALQEILQNVPFLVVKTNKTDIYGRYVADVFLNLDKKKYDPQFTADKGAYLNQILLDRQLVSLWKSS